MKKTLWAIHDGQCAAAPLPKPVVAKVEKKVQSMTVQGRPAQLAASR